MDYVFWNNFQGITFQGVGKRCCMSELEIMTSPRQDTPEKLGFGYNLKHLKTSRGSLYVSTFGLALPKAIPSLAVFV